MSFLEIAAQLDLSATDFIYEYAYVLRAFSATLLAVSLPLIFAPFKGVKPLIVLCLSIICISWICISKIAYYYFVTDMDVLDFIILVLLAYSLCSALYNIWKL